MATIPDPPAQVSTPDGPGPYKIVAATSFGVFLSAFDASIVNVSLLISKISPSNAVA